MFSDLRGAGSRFRHRFRAAGDRRSRRYGEFLRLCGGVHLLGWNLPRKRRKRRREPKQSIGKRQQVHAPSSQSGGPRSSQKQGHPFPDRFPSSAASAWLSICRMGHRSSPLPRGLEDLHEGVSYIEQGVGSQPQALIHRARYLARQLRKFGYDLRITATNPSPA